MFHEWVQPIVVQYGLLAVFFIVMFESAGAPLPGETALILVSVYSGMTGDLNILAIVGLASAAAIIGDNIGYIVGRRYGLNLLRKYGARIGMSEKRIELGRFIFRKHGAKLVFFGRFVAFLRIFAALLAGVSRFDWRSFLFYNAAGGVCWASIFGFGGYFFGEAMKRVAGPAGLAALAVALVVMAVGFVVMRRQEHRFEEMMAAELEQERARGQA